MEYHKNFSLDNIHFFDEAGLKRIEEFRAIPNYTGKYEVSDLGRVKSLITNKILIPQLDRYGYLYTSISGTKKKIHQLVGLAFHENPENKPTINHIDEDKLNNKKNNLEWFTFAEQSKYSRGIDVKLLLNGDIISFPSVLEAKTVTGLDNGTIKILSDNYNRCISIVNNIICNNVFSIPDTKDRKIFTNNSSGYTGINFKNGKWICRVGANGTRVYIGDFETAEEAVRARDNYIVMHNLNLPLQLTTKELVHKDKIIKSWLFVKNMIPENECNKEFISMHESMLLEYLK